MLFEIMCFKSEFDRNICTALVFFMMVMLKVEKIHNMMSEHSMYFYTVPDTVKGFGGVLFKDFQRIKMDNYGLLCNIQKEDHGREIAGNKVKYVKVQLLQLQVNKNGAPFSNDSKLRILEVMS